MGMHQGQDKQRAEEAPTPSAKTSAYSLPSAMAFAGLGGTVPTSPLSAPVWTRFGCGSVEVSAVWMRILTLHPRSKQCPNSACALIFHWAIRSNPECECTGGSPHVFCARQVLLRRTINAPSRNLWFCFRRCPERVPTGSDITWRPWGTRKETVGRSPSSRAATPNGRWRCHHSPRSSGQPNCAG